MKLRKEMSVLTLKWRAQRWRNREKPLNTPSRAEKENGDSFLFLPSPTLRMTTHTHTGIFFPFFKHEWTRRRRRKKLGQRQAYFLCDVSIYVFLFRFPSFPLFSLFSGISMSSQGTNHFKKMWVTDWRENRGMEKRKLKSNRTIQQ